MTTTPMTTTLTIHHFTAADTRCMEAVNTPNGRLQRAVDEETHTANSTTLAAWWNEAGEVEHHTFERVARLATQFAIVRTAQKAASILV